MDFEGFAGGGLAELDGEDATRAEVHAVAAGGHVLHVCHAFGDCGGVSATVAGDGGGCAEIAFLAERLLGGAGGWLGGGWLLLFHGWLVSF